MTLHNVSIEDLNYPCVMYAMRRSGMADMDIKEFYHAGQPYDEKLCTPGAVLIWEIDAAQNDIVAQTIEDSVPISTSVRYDRHFGVYEGNNKVSDTTVVGEHSLVSIRIRRLSDIRKPDLIISAIEYGLYASS